VQSVGVASPPNDFASIWKTEDIQKQRIKCKFEQLQTSQSSTPAITGSALQSHTSETSAKQEPKEEPSLPLKTPNVFESLPPNSLTKSEINNNTIKKEASTSQSTTTSSQSEIDQIKAELQKVKNELQKVINERDGLKKRVESQQLINQKQPADRSIYIASLVMFFFGLLVAWYTR